MTSKGEIIEKTKVNPFGIACDLPVAGDTAVRRELQVNIDESIKQNKQKSWDLQKITKFNRLDLSKVGIWDVTREECKHDFFYFIKTVLNAVSPPNEVGVRAFDYSEARHFKQMFRLINGDPNFELSRFGTYSLATKNKKHNKKLGLLPRIHGKTTVGNVAYNMWRLYKNPNLRILIHSEVRENAVKMLGMVKHLYELIKESKNMEEFAPYAIMGDWVGKMWNEDEIKVKLRTSPLMTPSISTAGMESEIVSQHYDIINTDDPIGPKNTTTPEQIEKHKTRLSTLTEMGDYDRLLVTLYLFWGTIWHYSDWYNKALEEMSEYFDILKLKCWDEKTKEPLFPEKYSTELLEEIKTEKMLYDPMEWANQWLNEPIASGHALFNPKEDFQWYDQPPKGLMIGIFVDTAWTKNKWSDYTAIVPVGVGNYNRRYVFPYENVQEDKPNIIADLIIKVARRYYGNGLRIVAIEEGALFNVLYPILEMKAPWIRCIPIKIKNRSAEQRVYGLQPLATNKKIYLQRNMHELIEQLVRFGRYSHDDLAIAFASHLDIWPVMQEEIPEKERPFPTNSEQFAKQLKRQDLIAEQRRQL